MALSFCVGALFLRPDGALFRLVAARAREGFPGFSSGGVSFLFWTIFFFFATDWLVLMIPIRLLRIGRFASGFSHVSKEVISYKNYPR